MVTGLLRQHESQKYLDVTLTHLTDMCKLLEECSDFWLMLHHAELQLRKLEKESKYFCDGDIPDMPQKKSRETPPSVQGFCEHVRSFCGFYCGVPPVQKIKVPVARIPTR